MIAAAIGALSMGAASAWAAEPTAADLKIQELEAKVAALEAKQASNSKDLAATIEQVLRDADKRSQLLANGADMAAGYDSGFFIRGGAWELRPNVLFQFRNVTNCRTGVLDDDEEGGTDHELENGFEIARLRVELAGTAFTKDLTYLFAWDSSSDSGSLTLSDAWVKYMFADDWGTRIGQFRDMTTHEFLVHEGRQLAADRSLADGILGGTFNGYTQGASLVYGDYAKNNPLFGELAFTDGLDAANTPFTDTVISDPDLGSATINWGMTGRVEYLVMGNWLNYRDFTAKDTKEDLLVIGAGGSYSQAGDGNLFAASADVQYENTAGLGVFAAGYYQHIDDTIFADVLTDNLENWGALVQVGYMLNAQWELFGRADVVFFDEEQLADEDTFYELTVGINYYLGKNGSALHRAKITVDVTYLPNGSPLPVQQLDIMDNNNGENEFIIRGQFQLWI
jgi:hypothetical protein